MDPLIAEENYISKKNSMFSCEPKSLLTMSSSQVPNLESLQESIIQADDRIKDDIENVEHKQTEIPRFFIELTADPNKIKIKKQKSQCEMNYDISMDTSIPEKLHISEVEDGHEQPNEGESSKEPHSCSICKLTTSDVDELQNHLCSNDSKKINIGELMHSMIDNELNNSNINSQGTVIEENKHIYNCPLCEYSSHHKFSVEDHVEKIHIDKKLMGKLSDTKQVKKRKKQIRKSKKEITNRNFLCEFCDYRAKENNHLSAHIKSIHLKIKDFKCDKCEFSASQKVTLTQHIKVVHLKIKKYKCDFCDYKAFQKSALTLHMNTSHKNIFQYKCDQCDYGTNLKHAFTEHTSTNHLMIKNEKCQYCDYSAYRRENLKFHIDSVHLKIRDQKCHLCDYATCKKYNLQNHIKLVHMKIKKLKCELCKYSTFYLPKLKIHSHKVHKIQIEDDLESD